MQLAPLLLALAVALPLARALGALAARIGQPPVLGELCAGLLLSLFPVFGDSTRGFQLLAELGAALLLFEAGLDSDPRELLRAGAASMLVACAGVIAPTLAGAAAARLLLPGAPPLACFFIGATLSATSVGITVRVLRDLGKSQAREARIVIGAAVVDDVLGLLLLSLLVAAAHAQDAGGSLSGWAPVWLFLKAALFLGGSVAILPALLRKLPQLQGRSALPAGLALCFALSWLADAVGLAPVVGAFVAGVVLAGPRATELRSGVEGIGLFLVPVFFVAMGLRVDLVAALRGPAPALGLALVAVAIAGKLVSGLAAPGKGLDRLAIGVGMIPRGEVGLIFAGIGRQLVVRGEPLVSGGVTSALVLVMLVTTLLTPPLLRWTFSRGAAQDAPAAVAPDLP